MFDIGALELMAIVVVAIVVIGPKDMPQALRVAGRWVGKLRRASAQFRAGFDNLVREAELEEMEKKWKAQNEQIMAEHPDNGMGSADENENVAASAESAVQNMSQKTGQKAAQNMGGGQPEDLMENIELGDGAQIASSSPSDAAQSKSGESGDAKPDRKAKAGDMKRSVDEPMLPLGKPGEQ